MIRIPARRPVVTDADYDREPPEDFNIEHQQVREHEEMSDDEDSDDGRYGIERSEHEEHEGYDEEYRDGWEWGLDGDAADDEEVEDFRREVDRFATEPTDLQEQEQDSPPNPDHTSTGGRTSQRTKPDNYMFCPLEHRLSILRLAAKHASQHPLLPERHGSSRTADEIWRDAVTEMYTHCEMNRLSEVWAYLWNNWYKHDRWPLWARSANGKSIPCHRTTMMVESLWRNIKRLVLHMFNRPPLDLANFMIITQGLPPYWLTLSNIITIRGGGRLEKLSNAQTALKASWERLAKVPIKGRYQTDIAHWTCDCGSQKYHAFLLCKHLVQAAGSISPRWWQTVIRYHEPPFYIIDGVATKAPERKCDYDWLQRMGPEAVAEAETGSDSDIDGHDTPSVCARFAHLTFSPDMLSRSYRLLRNPH